jgi:succinoglycan biosynthesis transport protein ExoP
MTVQPDQIGPEPLEPAASHSTLRPLQLAWKHKGLVSLGVVIGGVLGALYYVQAKPVYQSGAQVLVIKKRPEALPMAGNDSRMPIVEDYLATHQVLIKSPLIVSEAVREGKLGDLESFVGGQDATGKIIEALKITREIRENQPTNILNITCRSPVSADCGIIVNAVIESYHKFLKSTYRNVSDDTARLITQARDILENKLSITDAEYRKFRLDHPILWKNKEGVSVVQDRLQGIEVKRSGLLVRQSEIEGRIALFKKALQEKRSREELLAMVALSTGRLAAEAGKMPTAEDPLTALILQEQTLQEDYGPDYPQLKSVRKRIALLRGQRDREGRSDDGPAADPVKAHLSLLEREAEDARIGAEGLAKLLKNEQEEAKKLVNYENLDDTYRTEISRNQQLFESISKRLTEVNLLKDFGGFECQSIAPAVNGWKVGPKAVPIFVVAAFLGLLLGFGMAYLTEISDQSFRTPEEIRRRLGLPLIGHIPFFKPKENAENAGQEGPQLNPILVAANRSKSREAEAYRVVRTSLFFSSRSGGHKVIQVTSPDVGDGKSTLAANLAVSIAQSGKAVVIIDCDFRRPRIHKLFDVKATQGLASVILGEAELPDVIQASAIAGLSVLPCGPIPDNPAELLTQPRLKELLAQLREKYDFVVIDTPPLLAVTDPSVVAPLVDGIIMTVRISKNGRTHAQRAKEIMATLGANVLGVVVNGVGRDAEGYGYDKYHYGYSYQSYEYVYANGDADAYYRQDDTQGQDATEDQKSGTGHKSRGFFGRLFNR